MAMKQNGALPMGRVISALLLAYKAGPLSVILWGPPGTAKSALVKEFARQLNLPFIDVRIPLLDPVDMKGIPSLVEISIVHPNGKEEKRIATKFHAPDFLPSYPCVILFDELANGLPATQTATQRIILDRTSDGGWEAHPQTMIVAASNRKTDRTGVNTMPSALSNRLIHIEVEPDVRAWETWFLNAYSNNENEREAASQIIAYLNFKKGDVYNFDPDLPAKGIYGAATFRSWEMEAKLLIQSIESDLPIDDLVFSEMTKGTLGVGVGTQFMAFLRLRDKLPNPDSVLDGDPWDMPKEPDVRYAFVGALTSRLGSSDVSKKSKRAKNLWKVIKTFEDENAVEYAVCLVRMVLKQNRDLASMKEYVDWSQKHRVLAGC